MLEWYGTTQLQDDFTHRTLLLPGLRGSRERCRWLLRTRTDRRPMPERWDYKCIVSNRASPFWHFCVDDLLAFQFAQLEMSFPKGHTLDKWPPPWRMWTYSCAALQKASWSWNPSFSKVKSCCFSPANASFPLRQWDGTTSSVPGPVPATSSSCPSAFSEGWGNEPRRSHPKAWKHGTVFPSPNPSWQEKIPFFGCKYPKLIINHRAMFHWRARNPKCWIVMKRIEISPTCWLCRVWSVLTCSMGWEKFMPPQAFPIFLPGTAPEAPAESMLTCYNPSWKPKLAGKWFQHRLAFRMWWVGPGVGWNV